MIRGFFLPLQIVLLQLPEFNMLEQIMENNEAICDINIKGFKIEKRLRVLNIRGNNVKKDTHKS